MVLCIPPLLSMKNILLYGPDVLSMHRAYNVSATSVLFFSIDSKPHRGDVVDK